MAKKKSNRARTEGVIAPTLTLQEKLKTLDLESLELTERVDDRFKQLILKFANYLRSEGYLISVDALIKFFALYKDFDVFQLDEIRYTLRSLFAKDKEQFDQFNDQFDRFFYGSVEYHQTQVLTGEKEKRVHERTAQLKVEQDKKAETLALLSEKLAQQEAQAKQYLQTLREKEDLQAKEWMEKEMERLATLELKSPSTTVSTFKNYQQWINENPQESVALIKELERMFSKETIEAFQSLLHQKNKELLMYLKERDNGYDQLAKLLNHATMESLSKLMNQELTRLCVESAKRLSQLTQQLKKSQKEMSQKLMELKNVHEVEKQKTQNEITELRKQTSTLKQTVQQLDQKIVETAEIIEKEFSQQHRLEFVEGKNSVQTTMTNLDLLGRDIEKMNTQQYQQLTDVIKANATKFRTKLSRAMMRHKSKQFNYHRTMKNSLKTFGVPMELFYEKPKIKKTKIICILDVSGSCSKSSQLLLRFIYELSSVFKGGIKSYVFVKELQEVSQYFTDYHLNEAIELALKAVPRDYSNYYHALSQFHQAYLGEVDRNTIVIFLGDARNNKNPTGSEFLQAIQAQAKATFWLNTEEKQKWNVNDSIIGIYEDYLTEVHEILTTNDLIKFLEGFKLS